ncbi:MAG: hypothetical protein D6808_00760 [Candidatus Dadabacteria bacterium]|nr:MAG: hypothetical protein D6808_00760 [Candidatus Dadabacteria bacterium]
MDQVCPEIKPKSPQELAYIEARRTAFIARFIVLRESRRTRAHRKIEQMEWSRETTAEEVAEMFRQAFIENGDNMVPVERDIRRALAHADRSLNHFIKEYASRATLNFIDALCDYERSNQLLFGEDEEPKSGGWRLAQELVREREKKRKNREP